MALVHMLTVTCLIVGSPTADEMEVGLLKTSPSTLPCTSSHYVVTAEGCNEYLTHPAARTDRIMRDQLGRDWQQAVSCAKEE